MGRALYGPADISGQAGYYRSDHVKSARRGDFITSVEVGPLFGAVLARALDKWWEELGSPKEFYVFDFGAGVGTLARSILRSKPACMKALQYVLVEQSEYLASMHTDLLERTDVSVQSLLANPSFGSSSSGEAGLPAHNKVPSWDATFGDRSVEHGVVIANELLDNLPIVLLEKISDGTSGGEAERGGEGSYKAESADQNMGEWDTDTGDMAGQGGGGEWAEVFVTLDTVKREVAEEELIGEKEMPESKRQLVALARRFAPDAKVGTRIPIVNRARKWLAQMLGLIENGKVLVFDYGTPSTQDLVHRPPTEWLRTYLAHNRGGSPYALIGHQDITCEIPIDQLSEIREPNLIQTQKDFLESHGIHDLVTEAKEALDSPEQSAPTIPSKIPTDLKTLELRSRIPESQALLDPFTLGSHLTLLWQATPTT